ncbi:hypothetical protein ACFVSN_31000 [Kitasatospora sp. NPDC057904]|uniref:hypothetical protein n=1 Tax=Kitasatospora sp. NPDC057904 TaxID=3346275 RepID=UPI0036DAD70E
MADPHAEQPNIRLLLCEDCQAEPDSGEIRTIAIGRDRTVTETWHTDRCPTYTIERILMEAGAERAKEQDARAKESLSAAYRRLQDAAARVPAGDAAAPFVAALLEILQAQTDDSGLFVTLPTWAEILERHFPPTDPA